MKVRTAWPWISLLLLALMLLSPPGREIFNNLFSNESLSRYLAQFAALVYFGGVLALVMFEFAGRVLLMRRARRQATTGKSE